MFEDLSYDEALAEGRRLNPGLRIGKPGRMGGWPFIAPFFQALRIPYSLDCAGQEHVAAGPAILVSNHQSMLDPVVTVTATRWRVVAFTKAEAYAGIGAYFFGALGQIPLRRGDNAVTDWALDMARRALVDGNKIGIYPEGTRGPDTDALYRLHQRVLVPLLQQSPDVPVHTVAVRYGTEGLRRRITVRISPRVDLDARTMSGEEMTRLLTESLVTTGDLRFVDEYAFTAKRRRAREAEQDQA